MFAFLRNMTMKHILQIYISFETKSSWLRILCRLETKLLPKSTVTLHERSNILQRSRNHPKMKFCVHCAWKTRQLYYLCHIINHWPKYGRLGIWWRMSNCSINNMHRIRLHNLKNKTLFNLISKCFIKKYRIFSLFFQKIHFSFVMMFISFLATKQLEENKY